MFLPQGLELRVAVAQMRPLPANVQENLKTILAYIDEARHAGAKLVVFPELATSGYLLGDRWEYDEFIREIEHANQTIRDHSQGLTVVWGSVKAEWGKIGEDGRLRKYNAAFIAYDGAWASNGHLLGWIPKTNLPKYRIFDDAKHFYPAAKLALESGIPLEKFLRPFEVVIDHKKFCAALTICEDLWEDEYNVKPSRIYAKYGAHLLINVSCSPWTADKWKARDAMLRRRRDDAETSILYVNAVGLQNNGKNLVWFDGDSLFLDDDGSVKWRAPQHEAGLYLLDLHALRENAYGNGRLTGIGEIYEAVLAAMRQYFEKFPRVVYGLSGGIDSAVGMTLTALALGSHKVLALNMPTEYNSKTTRSLAHTCAKRNGVEYRVVPIQERYEAQLRTLAVAGYLHPSMLVRENIQARIRGDVLASVAQAEGGVFTNNGNKTEVALNYFTLYGDGAGAASFLGDLWKGQVYAMARYINDRHRTELIPQGIIDVVPSAELSSEQNVEEGKGDPIFYPYHDELLRMFTERRFDPTMVLDRALRGTLEDELGCEPGTIAKYFPSRKAFVANLEWAWKQYNMEFKRVQLPPVFLTSRRAFGFDRRDTIAEAYLAQKFFELKALYLREKKGIV